jgi:hypothetical protein
MRLLMGVMDRSWLPLDRDPPDRRGETGLGSADTAIVGSDDDGCLGRCLDLCGVESLELGRRDVAERLVQACAVEPAEVLDDGEFDLAAGAPDAIADELGLDRVDEGLRERVVVGVTDRPELAGA